MSDEKNENEDGLVISPTHDTKITKAIRFSNVLQSLVEYSSKH